MFFYLFLFCSLETSHFCCTTKEGELICLWYIGLGPLLKAVFLRSSCIVTHAIIDVTKGVIGASSESMPESLHIMGFVLVTEVHIESSRGDRLCINHYDHSRQFGHECLYDKEEYIHIDTRVSRDQV